MKKPDLKIATLSKSTTSSRGNSPKAPTKKELRLLLRKIGPILRGESPIDLDALRVECTTEEDVERFLKSYGISLEEEARIEAIRREAVEFIENYFLKDEDLHIPEEIASPAAKASNLILLATSNPNSEAELFLRRWACALLRVMHTIYHLGDDIRFKYVHQIQGKIVDKFREHIFYDSQGQMRLGKEKRGGNIPLEAFDIKRVKERESIILKLLHKRENIVTEITDVVGLRLVSRSKVDALRILNYLVQGNLLSYPNSIPGQAKNTLVFLDQLEKVLDRGDEKQIAVYIRLMEEGVIMADRSQDDNPHSLDYRAMNITGREKVELENQDYATLRTLLDKVEEEHKKLSSFREPSEAQKAALASLQETSVAIKGSLSKMNQYLTFYYPFEIQIMDIETYHHNQKSVIEYKENQRQTAKQRVLASLLETTDYKSWGPIKRRGISPESS